MRDKFDEVFQGLPSGWLSEGEARLLWNEAGRTDGPILEVGCYRGRSTCLLAALGRPMYCVDPFSGFDSDDPTGERILACWRENVSSRELFPALFRTRVEDWEPIPVGFAYLDGDHTYRGTRNQVEKALQCGPSAIAVHDVNDSGGGVEVKKACLEALGKWTTRTRGLAVWRLK